MAILRLLGLWITAPTICDDTKPQTTRQIQLSPRDGQYLGEGEDMYNVLKFGKKVQFLVQLLIQGVPYGLLQK